MDLSFGNRAVPGHQGEASNIRPRFLSMICECLFPCILFVLLLVTAIVYTARETDRHVTDYIVKVANHSVNETMGIHN